MGNKIANAYGVGGPRIPVFPVPVLAKRAPINGQDVNYPQGQDWWNNSVSPRVLYTFNGDGTWSMVFSPSGEILSITGTTNQITASTVAGATTLTIPSTFIAPGSIQATSTLSGTTVTASAGNITATNGNLVLGTAGNKILIATGANASAGTTAAMSGSPGAVSVSSTAITTSSLIQYSRNITGGTPGEVSITAQTTGSFTLTSTGNETSTFNWWLVN